MVEEVGQLFCVPCWLSGLESPLDACKKCFITSIDLSTNPLVRHGVDGGEMVSHGVHSRRGLGRPVGDGV